MRAALVLDATLGGAEKQARVLSGFLRGGFTGPPIAECVVFHSDADTPDALAALAPTADVRLVRTAARRPDRIAAILAEWAGRDGISLFLFAGGASTAEAAARSARRAGGSALIDALSVEVGADRLVCRANVYSAHMVGRFELTARPWCVTVDAGWADGPAGGGLEHRVVAATDETAGAGAPPFEDLELVVPASKDGLAGSRFLVVAGRGAGDRAGVERIAEAARRMGAAFGVTRAVAMNAWAPVDRLVGVSGVRLAPELCILVGASGAPALRWGIEKARHIVAVNTDEHAPAVRDADLAVIDDGVSVLEALADVVEAGSS